MTTAGAVLRRYRGALTVAAVAVAVVAVSGFVAFRHLIERTHVADIRVAFQQLTTAQLSAAPASTLLSYLLLTL